MSFAKKEQIVLRSSTRSHQANQLSQKSKQQNKLKLPAIVKLRKIVVGTIVGGLINSLVLLPVVGAEEEAQLAVVKSLDNQGHWSGIAKRLYQTGVNYCIVDFSQVEQASDLGSTKLLFLPNIELFRPTQLAALQAWMRRGGQVIVSGPTGTLSQPEVRNRLRSLLGAYWGFTLSQPSTLEPLPSETQTWVSGNGLGGKILGGAVIPAGTKSATAAIWNLGDNSPAVVTTENSTFFGWRWGDNQVASQELDLAWLQAVLNRYEIVLDESTTDSEESSLNQQPYCLPSQEANSNKNLSSGGISNPTDTSQTRTLLAPVRLTAMVQELEELLGRFESALLAANAANSDIDLTTTNAIEQFTTPSAKETRTVDNSQTARGNVATGQATQALNQARTSLVNFRAAVAKRDYREAGDQLHQARRTLWQNYPTDRQLAQPEIRAIWLDRGTIVKAKSEKDLAKIFDKLAQAGFNTVFFETVNASYPIYPSKIAPEQNPLVKGWDPLQAAVQLAHERGMELHAWVWMFAAANRRHNAILNQPADYPGPVLERHPDWAIFDKQGRLFHQDTQKAFLDPANPEVRSYLTALLEEIASRYEVDGIQIDYIRYPFQDPRVNQTYGYGKAARERFKELSGVDPIKVYPRDRRLWQKWTEFRVQQINSFVATVSERLREKRPELILSAA
ncbi:MAG: family 10 glycosylhydrolase, partial [Coleofasciculaceae cyanobacterium]